MDVVSKQSSSSALRPALDNMLTAYQHVQSVMKEMQVWKQHRLDQGSIQPEYELIPAAEDATKQSHGLVSRGIDSGDHRLATMGILGLISHCHAEHTDDMSVVMERLQPYVDALAKMIKEASHLMGETTTLLEDDTDNSEQSKKRRRTLLDRTQAKLGTATEQMVRTVQSEVNGEWTDLDAAQHRLLCTVIPESALLPDVAAMHDTYHPNVALYNTKHDQQWNAPPGVHMGFFGSTMMREFVVHRGCMRRFSFVHLMQRMGFGAADINFFVTYLDDTFFRCIYTDSRIGFLAESFSPRMRVFRGREWANLWDSFLVNQYRSGQTPTKIGRSVSAYDGVHWTETTRAAMLVDAIIKENADTETAQLLPHTVLGALHRRHGVCMKPYDAWSVMEHLNEVESEFLEGAHKIQSGALVPSLDAVRTFVRAWPVCLRWAAVEHVRRLVQTMRLIPRTLQIAQTVLGESTDVARAAEWIWSLVQRRDDTEGDITSQSTLLLKMRETTSFPTIRLLCHYNNVQATPPATMVLCEELDETTLTEAVRLRYGDQGSFQQKSSLRETRRLRMKTSCTNTLPTS